jgi:hypothetical protein
MSRYEGGMVGSVANVPSGTAYTGRANGVFILPTQIANKSSSLWSIGQTKPNPPSIGTAFGVNATSISVAFTPDTLYGGFSDTVYTATSNMGQSATGSSSPIIVTGLTAGQTYTFTVTATNNLGVSSPSGTSNSVMANSDPYFSSVDLLLHANGVNGSTTFIDSSSSPKSITAYGNAVISTTQAKFGTSSMYFDGTGDYLTTNVNSLPVLTGDFTIECWAYRTQAIYGYDALFTTKANVSWAQDEFNTSLVFSAGGFHGLGASWTPYPSGASIPTGAWTHAAVTRSGSTVRFFIGGSLVHSHTYSGNVGDVAYKRGIGIFDSEGGGPRLCWNGYIDDFRITRGVARYTSAFTPPTSEF